MTKRAPPQHHLEQFIVSVICSLVMVWLSSLAIVYGQIPDQDFQWMLQAAVPPVTSGAAAGWADPNTYQGLWEFETTNTTATLDTSGAGHTMTNLPNVATGPTWTIVGTNQYGRVEHGYTFDGSSTYFKDGSVLNGATSITMFAWINYTVQVNYGGVLFERDTGLIWQGSGLQKMRFDVGSNTTYSTCFMATAIPSNEWHFVWARWKSYTTPEIYYDNVLDCIPAASNSLGAMKIKTTPGMLIGYNNENIAYFKGMVDGVGMFVNGATGYADTNIMQQIMNNTHPTNNVRVR